MQHTVGRATQSPSPPRARPRDDFDESNATYQTALRKLFDVAWKFDREKNAELLRTLESKELAREQFKFILRSSLNCKLDSEEFEAFANRFENNGCVDGTEFILMFYRLRYEYRSQLQSKRLKKERQMAAEAFMKKEKKRIELEQRNVITLTSDYSEKDLESALAKITEASVKYDRLMPGAVQLDAFECEYMEPNVFREQLKLVFNIQFSLGELSAFIRDFNKTGDHGGGDNVYCAPFLVKFFRMGFEERQKRLVEIRMNKKRIAAEKLQKEKEEAIEEAKRNDAKVNYNFTEEDKARAVKKLRVAAKLYDKTTPGAMSMKAFEVAFMPPHVFKEQLRKVFNLHVDPIEMGALMDVFDIDHDGVITCEEFSKVFLNMGFAERSKELKESTARQKALSEERERVLEKKREQLSSKVVKISYDYTNEEFESAMFKLVEAAWRFDKTMPGAPSLDAFDVKTVDAFTLREQLNQTFHTKVSPAELGAILQYFDADKEGNINCEQFLKRFFKIGYEERQRRHQEWRQYQKELIEFKEKKKKAKQQQLDEKLALTGAAEFAEADFQSAFAKLNEGALKYDRSLAGAVGLDAFEAISMPPHVFKEQLKLVFNIKVTLPELSALLSYFDREGTGSINCKDFVKKFLRSGIEQRHRMQKEWRDQQRQRAAMRKERSEQEAREKHRKAWAEVDFDFGEEDFDAALHKLMFICHQFDPRQLGPAGWRAFQPESLNPKEFREVLKRTFDLKVSPQELGALVTYFDEHRKKVARCSTFLNYFVQIRVRCEAFKGKPDEEERMQEYHAELKQQYELRMERRRNSDSDAAVRPWRSNAVRKRPFLSSSQYVKSFNTPAPTTALEKYKLRVAVAKKTGKLDLASKAIWAAKESSSFSSEGGANAAATAITTAAATSAIAQQDMMENASLTDMSLRNGDLYAMKTDGEGEGDAQGEVEGEEDLLEFSGEYVKEGADVDADGDVDQPGEVSAGAASCKGNGEGEGEGGPDDKERQRALAARKKKMKKASAEKEAATSAEVNDEMFSDCVSVTGSLAELSLASTRADAKGKKVDPEPAAAPVPDQDTVPTDAAAVDIEDATALQKSDGGLIVSGPTLISAVPSSQLTIPRSRPGSRKRVAPSLATMRGQKKERNKEQGVVYFRLNTFPPAALKLSDLTEIWLCNNVLTTVPPEIADLKFLQTLSLKNNRLETIPPEICLLDNLQRLYLNGNNLSSLPNIMGRMNSLSELDISANAFTEFPQVVTAVPYLLHLYIGRNNISILPGSLRKMRMLIFLSVEECSFADVTGAAAAVDTGSDTGSSSSSSSSPGLVGLEVLSRMPWLEVHGIKSPSPRKQKRAIASTAAAAALPGAEGYKGVGEVGGGGQARASSESQAKTICNGFSISPEEEEELTGLLKSRANFRITSKLRRRKKKSAYDLSDF